MRVVTVLRSGGGFTAAHVQALHRQVRKWLPGVESFCLTDGGPIPGVAAEPLRLLWPGWWSKMELFAPWVEGDLLFLDLDTIVVGPLSDVASANRLTLMRDVCRPAGLQSSVMLLPESARAEVWDAWMRNPHAFMKSHQRHGDQGFLETLWLDKAARWQDILPGQVVSYKADVRKNGDRLPADARLVAFHGRPRPWALPPNHALYITAGY